ncbi:MAG TPA: hypothetical protein VM580_31565 [Labilithrix sp.]|nr:hypothetical protein [Labilithrix sp.]
MAPRAGFWSGGGGQFAEQAVALVGVGREEIALAEAGVRSEPVHLPPTTAVRSRPACQRTVATSEVVVLPCEPAMSTPACRRAFYL